ncbi:MAG: OmpH family outer membrane protein [Endomicrobia bacterium]|nr:OmpH family outer membrane protein [Endomicrobiia bacterium]MCL2506890.1 OmpH family outer membrane protein [Endomicrobiia bacterium]
MMNKLLVSFLFSILFISQSFAIEIPLVGAIQRDKKNETTILFVDMEKVFAAHPLTEKYKTDLKNFANTRKTALDEMVKQYKSMQEEIQSMSLKIVEAEENKDEQLLSEIAKRYDEVKKSLAEQKEKIDDLTKRTKDELSRMEENNSLNVLKEIELLIKEISNKRGSTVVLEKQSVLCTTEDCQDITEEVIKQSIKKQ